MNSTLKIISQKENPLFKRKEIEAEFVSEVSPKREELAKLVAHKFSSSIDAVMIKRVGGKFGSKTFSLSANIYQDKQAKNSVELKKKKEDALDNKQAPSETESKAEEVVA